MNRQSPATFRAARPAAAASTPGYLYFRFRSRPGGRLQPDRPFACLGLRHGRKPLANLCRGICPTWGTPWGLVSSSKTQTVLGGFFLLQKAQAFSLQTLDPALLSDYLRQEHDNPLKILPEPLKQKAYSNFTALSRQVPAWKMSFAKDFIDWKAIDRAMEDRGK